MWGRIDFTGKPLHSSGDRTPVASGDFISDRCGPGIFASSSSALYDRDNICRLLGLERDGVADVEIILRAYEKWGDRCPEFLTGEFAFCIWDARVGRLLCCRDHVGKRAFYYSWDGERFHFASSPVVLLKSGAVDRKLNRRKLAGLAVQRGDDYYDEETWHAGVLSLPSGSILIGSEAGVRTQVYWRPEIRSHLVPSCESDAFSALRFLLEKVVDDQIGDNEKPASLLSGGLDSSAVTALAAICMRKRNRSLLAISAVVPEQKRQRYRDEREYIEEFSCWPNIRIEYVAPSGSGPFDLIHDSSYYEETFTWSSRQFLYKAFEKVAQGHGANLIMEGIGGEYGPTCYAHGYLVELAIKFQFPQLFRVLKDLQSASGVTPLRALAGDFLRTLTPSRGYRSATYLNEAFVRKCESRRTEVRYWRDHRLTQRDQLATALRKHAYSRILPTFSSVHYGWPLFDHRLLEFCISLPGSMKLYGGYSRYLVRKALDGVLPKVIQWRRDKFPFSCDYPDRYAAQVSKAREFVAAISSADPVRTIVDVDRLKAQLATNGAAADSWDALICIPRSIYLICFLRQFAEFRC